MAPETQTTSREAAHNPALLDAGPKADHSTSIGAQSFLQFINAVGNEGYFDDDDEEAEPEEQVKLFRNEKYPSHDSPLQQDPMASSIHTIYRPIERKVERERMVQSQILDKRDTSQSIAIEESQDVESEEDEADLKPLTPGTISNSQDQLDMPPSSVDASASIKPPTHISSAATLKSDRKELLAEKLQQVFELSDREEVLAEYQASLFRSVLLQGYIYLTSGHVCFYAYLRSREGQVIKSSSLGKRSSRSRRFHKHWFVLKDDILRWYPSASEPYFPDGDVSLHYITSVQPSRKNSLRFKVLTSDRQLIFSADSTMQRDDWVKTLTKAVYQCQNEGDSIKISIPLEMIVSVDKASLDFIDALSLRVMDTENGLAIETYPFCYLSNLQDTFERIQNAVTSFRRDHPDIHQKAMDKISDNAANASLTSSIVSERPSSLTTSTSTATLSNLVHRFNPFAPTTEDPSLRKRRPSTETITQLRSDDIKAGSESEKHTYPPDSTISTPALSESPGRSNSWQMPSVASWVKNAPNRIISTVAKPATASLTSLPGFSSLGLSSTKTGRRVFETIESPTRHNSTFMSVHAEDEYGDSSTVALKVEEQPTNHSKEADRELLFTTFNIPNTEDCLFRCHAYLYRGLPIYGNLFVCNSLLCFKSTNLFSDTKMILPLKDVIAAQSHRSYRFGYFGLVLIVKSHEELFFELSSEGRRDIMRAQIEQRADFARQLLSEGLTPSSKMTTDRELDIFHLQNSDDDNLESDIEPSMFQSSSSSFIDFKPKQSLRFACLTIGSRGDVQPYIALCKGLIREGHSCRIASHPEYRKWVEGHGIEFREVGGDPAELMRICVQNDMFTIGFMKETFTKFRGWLDDLLQSSWSACQGSDVLIESPSAMAGIHIAEALRIPYYRAFTMPWSRTRTYPHAFAVPGHKLGGQYNYLTYTMFDTVFWKAIAGQINRWRKLTLDLQPTSLDKLDQGKVPFLYNLSPSLMPPPLDWPEWIHVTGYWFLEDDSKATGWTPPSGLLDFIKSSREADKKLVYIGFGSIVVEDAEGLTRTVHAAVEQAGVKAIVSKGWAGRLSSDLTNADEKAEFEKQEEKEKQLLLSSENIHTLESVPHDWLFPQVDAICMHGGSGTVGASLKAGKPTIVKPFFGDQFFQAERIESLGVGIALRKLTVESLSDALEVATTDEKQKLKASVIGAEIRKQNGVANAIEMIYRDLEYARSQIKQPGLARPVEKRQSVEDAAPSTARQCRRQSTSNTEDTSEESSWDQMSSTNDDVLSRSGIGSTPPRSIHEQEDTNLESSGELFPRSRSLLPRHLSRSRSSSKGG